MRATDFTQRKFYHGSNTKLPTGTILKAGADYEANWSDTDFYPILEKYRPQDQLGHNQAVFMCDNEDDVDSAGGGTEWLFTVVTQGIIQRHDLNWGSEISCLISDGADPQGDEVKRAAENYWAGVPHHNESMWEYLTPAAKIIKVEKF